MCSPEAFCEAITEKRHPLDSEIVLLSVMTIQRSHDKAGFQLRLVMGVERPLHQLNPTQRPIDSEGEISQPLLRDGVDLGSGLVEVLAPGDANRIV